MKSVAWQLMSEEDYGDYIEEQMQGKWVSRELAVAIVNDDYSGISDADQLACNGWLTGHVIITSDDTEFTRCDITGLMADCVQVFNQ